MKNANKFKKFLTKATLVAMMLAASQSLYAVNINQEILELKNRYEDAYHRYTTAIKEGATATIKDLGKQVEQAKAKYEEAKRKLSLSEDTKEKIKDGYETVKERISDTFAQGTGNTTDLSTDNQEGGKTIAGFDDYQVTISGDNYCGQFATNCIFQYYGINKDGNKIYSETNPAGIFTAPSTLVEYLNLNGLDANERNNASLSDLIKKLDSNTPVECLVCSDGETPHWICVYGYETNEAGKVTSIKMRDSYWGYSKCKTMDIEEFKENFLNQPYGDIWLIFNNFFFKNHPYKWMPIGKEINHIEKVTMQDMKAFFYHFYRPNNAVLCLSGNIHFDEVVPLVEKWFGDIPAGDVVTKNFPKEQQNKIMYLLSEWLYKK